MESKSKPDEIRVNQEYSVLMKILEDELEKLNKNHYYVAAQAVSRIVNRLKQAYGDDDEI